MNGAAAKNIWSWLLKIDRERDLSKSLWRYGFVGILNSAGGYCLYLVVTGLGVHPIVAMSSLYLVGTLVSFISNRKWAFKHVGKIWPSALRYCVAYFVGYCLNFLMLYFFSGRLGYPHQVVQAVSIFLVAGFLFLMLKFFVFPRSAGHTLPA
jgi:putative flippase GtrA